MLTRLFGSKERHEPPLVWRRAWVVDQIQFDVTDDDGPLSGGGVAYVVDLGHMNSQVMTVKSI